MSNIVGKQVNRVGYGLMGLSWRPNPCPIQQAFDAMNTALANGANFWNGGEFYGTPEYNSMTILSAYFEAYPEAASKVVLSMKGGMEPGALKPDGSPTGVRRSLDNILAGLGGRKFLDVFECARRDPAVPLALTLGIIQQEYIDTGKVGGVSLSEVSADTIHQAVKLVKIAAVEVELSLWSPDPLTNGVAAACAQYGIPLVAYAPLCHGALSGIFRKWEDIPADSQLHFYPRFSKEAFPLNVKLCDLLFEFAAKKGCTPAQLALGWILTQAKRPDMPEIIVIPGATTAARVQENCSPVELNDDEMREINNIISQFELVGARYPAGAPVNT
ncbi:hypothetical protein BROUX41_000869 [Berkeleyomyces rouxiae]|uniref:uncharacterized protein n=1 Tax=Berkeleyomyces rouxiae TaxID=2035830 RepID=UPI003B76D9CD